MFGMVDDDVSWKANNVVGAMVIINNMMMIVVEEMKQRGGIMIWEYAALSCLIYAAL